MAYRTTTARVERDQQLREHILACAHAQVVAGGFAALTMQGLAAEAGIATGSLYRHFSRKGELASEVFARASQREVDALAAVFGAPGSPCERLLAGGKLDARVPTTGRGELARLSASFNTMAEAVQTSEAAHVAAFLLSPRSSGMNGQCLVVDAGMGMNYFDAAIVGKAVG